MQAGRVGLSTASMLASKAQDGLVPHDPFLTPWPLLLCVQRAFLCTVYPLIPEKKGQTKITRGGQEHDVSVT